MSEHSLQKYKKTIRINKTKNLKETNLVLEACKKEYQKLQLYLKHKKLKKNTKCSKRNCLNTETITEVVEQQTRNIKKIKLNDIEFDEEKLRNLLYVTKNRKPKKKRYCDDTYSDDGTESDDKFSENNDKSSDEEIVKKKKKTQARKGTVAKMLTTEPATKKRRKNNKKELQTI